ncbi:MAG: aspartate aminotransferase family protein [Clostridia bacterium]|nr:aspartate aminotransferase family protein [Clostridia bacterium]
MADFKTVDKKYVANTYNRFDVEISHGKGAYAYDKDGKEYIDMGTGIGVNAFGYCDEVWLDAVKEQLSRIQHTSNLYYTEPCSNLAQILCEKTGFSKVFFSNSGAEANECAIKVARKYACDKYGEKRYNVITLKNSFHGRTITTLSATGQDVFHTKFKPLTEGFLYVDANDFDGLKECVENNEVAAIMLECVQGEGGVLVLDEEYVKNVANFAKERDILLIVDEVQTGNGRLGTLYGYMNYGITPDIVSTAKGLGGGLPIGATLLSKKVENVLAFGDHGSTFGGNPVVCAGAISIINRLTDEFLAEVAKKGEFIKQTLKDCNGILSVSGKGLMIGIETSRPAKEVVLDCIKEGVLCLTAKTKVRLLPPLNISYETLTVALDVIKNVCAK